MSNIYDIHDFKRKVKEAAPKDTRYVLIVVDSDGSDGFIEHHEASNGYEVLGIMEWGKSIMLASCNHPGDEK